MRLTLTTDTDGSLGGTRLITEDHVSVSVSVSLVVIMSEETDDADDGEELKKGG